MKKYKKYIILPLVLFVFATGIFIYYLPSVSDPKFKEFCISYGTEVLILVLLFFLLRKKDQMARRREDDIENNKHNL